MRGGGARLCLATILSLAAPARALAATYYVDNGNASCSNSGPGTLAQPYCTIAAAIAAHNGPSATIIVMPGIYRETVTVPASGSTGNPFEIRAQGAVIIDGADDFSSVYQILK